MTHKHFRALVSGFLVLCVMLFWSAHLQAKEFHVGYFLVKPHAMLGIDDKPAGVAVEYFRLIAEKMGLSGVQFSLFPLKRLPVELKQHKIDMVLLMAKNPERAANFVYPASPFCFTCPSIAVNAASDLVTVESTEALLSLTIQESAGAYRSPFIRDQRLKIEPLHGTDYTARCYEKLLKGRIDACYQPDHYPILFEANRDLYASKIRVITLPEEPIGLYSVFSKKTAEIYLEKYEKALEEVKLETSYEELFLRFIDNYEKPPSNYPKSGNN